MPVQTEVAGQGVDRSPRADRGIGYQILYRLGLVFWDQGQVPPEVIALADGPEALPTGRALDLGCGTGTTAVYLAGKGWDVTGIDVVERALVTARRKAAAAGVAPRWVRGDVSRMASLDIGSDFDLLVDYGCFHGLTDERREAYVEGASVVAAPGATFLLQVFAPGRRGPAPRGVSHDEIIRRFGGSWELLSARRATEVPLRGPLRDADPTVYRLLRR